MLLLLCASCNDFLDRSPQGEFTENDHPNALVNGKVYNVYTLMRHYDITAGPPALAIHCFRSEDSEKGSVPSDGSDVAAMYDDFIYTPTNGLLGAYWGKNYAVIYQCNDILDAIAHKEATGQSEAEDLINKGEASFFRAYCYFNLVRAFGDVPLVTRKINDASEANVPKSPAAEIYQQGRKRVHGRFVGYFVSFDVGDGAGEVSLLGTSVADDHGFAQQLGVFFQRHIDDCLRSYFHVLGEGAHIREHQHILWAGSEGILPVQVGDCSGGCSLNEDRRTD